MLALVSLLIALAVCMSVCVCVFVYCCTVVTQLSRTNSLEQLTHTHIHTHTDDEVSEAAARSQIWVPQVREKVFYT